MSLDGTPERCAGLCHTDTQTLAKAEEVPRYLLAEPVSAAANARMSTLTFFRLLYIAARTDDDDTRLIIMEVGFLQ